MDFFGEMERWFFVVCGIAIFFAALGNFAAILFRRRWPETVGRIQKNEMSKEPVNAIGTSNSELISKNTGRPIENAAYEFTHRLSYVYVVGGYKYIGEHLYSSPITLWRGNRIDGIYPGDKVKVFYHPKKPNKSFLAHSFAWPSFIGIATGLLCISTSIYFSFII